MAYYTALQAFWTGAIGGTTQAKLDWVNAQTVTGSPPTVFSVTSTDLYGAFDAGEWHAMCKANTNEFLPRIKELLALPGLIPVGSGTIANLYLFNCFASSAATLLKLAALAVAQVQPWWKANGYPRPFDLGDIAAAGLS